MQELLSDLGWHSDRLSPDKSRLDFEFERHPQDIALVCEKIAEAREVRDVAKTTKAMREAEVRGELIARFTAAGTKYTVGDLSTAIENSDEVKLATSRVIARDKDLEMWSGLLKALEAKTSALKHLSELWQAGYYTTSSSHEPPARVRRGRER